MTTRSTERDSGRGTHTSQRFTREEKDGRMDPAKTQTSRFSERKGGSGRAMGSGLVRWSISQPTASSVET